MALINLNRNDYVFTIFIMLAVCVQASTYKDSGYSIGKGSKGSTSSNSQNRIMSSDSALFTTRNNTKVIAQKGGLAVLPCAVKWNPTATVSWIRRRDFQLLTVGLSTYSSDDRFLVEHARHMGHWSLRIKSVREEDRGLYECQLSIHPTQSIFIELKVVEAVADIIGAPDIHVDEGSTLRLECRLRRATENPAFVFWYHNTRMVNYDTHNGFSVSSTLLQSLDETFDSNTAGVNAKLPPNATTSTNKNAPISKPKKTSSSSSSQTPSISILTINEVSFLHVGNYTCAPSNAKQASITVHVLRDEKPAAMQHANGSIITDEDIKSNSRHSQLPMKSKHILLIFILVSVIKYVYR
ncbi:uncharacterized protein LOC129567820 [Sitodiplosis mosellana]|uniref:uncharacterized protein LOC129567820 n=1 Tax=Sitodiplosis mosellana TaxID=263140 RepID=UPI0024446A3F|nr:uncharacterized protein LOC129567820 [Sitodiplosis mosellana]